LESILANANLEQVEVILVGYNLLEAVSNTIIEYPLIYTLRVAGENGIPYLTAAGIAQSTGEIIVLTDSSCVVESNWITSILSAHQSAFLVIGGTVEIQGRMKLLDLAAYFCEYGQFAKPLKSGASKALPGNNISFKRELLATESSYAKREFWKTYWCEELRGKGIMLMLDSSIRVFYTKSSELIPFLIRRFRQGRSYAAMRTKQFTYLKRLIYLAGSFFLPLVFLYRIISTIIGKKRFLKRLVLSFPFIVLAVFFWTIGETWGYATGREKNCDYI
jgi:hypothetical protein